jgi:magnesium chelatase family protein
LIKCKNVKKISPNLLFLAEKIMVEKIIGCALSGLKGQKVDIEVNVSRGAKFLMVGLPDNAVKESHYRIAAALKNIGFKIPIKV